MDDTLILTRKESAFEKRVHEIDFIRGVLIILVLLDHFFWFSEYFTSIFVSYGYSFWQGLYNAAHFYENWGLRAIVREVALFSFVFVSGISCAFSKNNWKRAAKLLVIYFLLYIGSVIVSGIANDNFYIEFNVIGVLAWSILIYCFVQNKSFKMSVVIALGALLFTIVVLYGLTTTGISDTKSDNFVNIPALWSPKEAADWLPMFPYCVFFFLGSAFSKIMYIDKKSLTKKKYNWEKPICFLGRHTLWFYFGAIPVYVIFYGIIALAIGIPLL